MSHVANFDSDPVIAQVSANLSVAGIGVPVLAGPPPEAGGNIMNALIGLMAKSSQAHAPVTTSSEQPSPLGPALAAGAAGLAVGAGAAAALMTGKGKHAASPVGTPPAPPAEVPAAKPSTPAKVDAKPADTPKTAPDPDKVTIGLSDEAAKKMKGSTWIGVGSKPGDAKPESGEKVPTTLTAIPASKPKPAGYEEITYDGKKYWVSPQDKNTYAAWNKSFATTGGLKPADAMMTPVAAAVPPKPAASTPAPKPVTPTPPAKPVAPMAPPTPAVKPPVASTTPATPPAAKPATPPPATPPAPPAAGTTPPPAAAPTTPVATLTIPGLDGKF